MKAAYEGDIACAQSINECNEYIFTITRLTWKTRLTLNHNDYSTIPYPLIHGIVSEM